MYNSRKIRFLFLVLLVVAVGEIIKIFFLDSNLSAFAQLRVDSFPKSSVFLNDKEIGQTPLLEEKLTAGEYNLKIASWQTKIKLTAGTLTYVSRDIATSDEQSAGQILMLEKLPSGQSPSVAIVASPDGADVQLDGLVKGKTPIVLGDVALGDHEIIISSDGFSDQIVKARIVFGYLLKIIIKLSSIGNLATSSGQLRPSSDLIASSAGVTKPYIVVADTPTGFLRVRFEPSSTASEVGRIQPGEKYPLLSEISGWVKIKLTNVFGWVSSDYVEVVK